MAFASTGTPVEQRNTFNSGLVTIDTDQLVDLQDITIDESFTEKNYRALNTILKQDIKRSEYEASISFTTMSNATALQKYFYSSESTVASGEVDYNVKDGQQDEISDFVLTLYYDEAKTTGIQFTVENPVLLSLNKAPSSQEFTNFDVTIACTKFSNIKEITA